MRAPGFQFPFLATIQRPLNKSILSSFTKCFSQQNGEVIVIATYSRKIPSIQIYSKVTRPTNRGKRQTKVP